MINLQNLSKREIVYLSVLIHKIFPELNISPDTLNSLKSGVIQFCFNSWTARPLKKKVIEKIINKIINPQIIDGEFTDIIEKQESPAASLVLENQNNEH